MAIVKFGFGPNMAYLPRQCVACNRVFAVTSNNNRYCSEYCNDPPPKIEPGIM